MKGFKTLLFKEWREQISTFRLLIVSGIFLFFGLLTPVMLKYLPELLKLAGEDLGGIVIPPPAALQALTEYSATALQMGLLVAVLVSMGAIAGQTFGYQCQLYHRAGSGRYRGLWIYLDAYR